MRTYLPLVFILLLVSLSSMTHANQAFTDNRKIDNLTAFVQLFGYIRYFHPSDAVAETNWDTFAFQNILSVEDAISPEDLANRLEALFKPYAPTLEISATSQESRITKPEPARIPAGAESATFWLHIPLAGEEGKLADGQRLSVPIANSELPEAANLPEMTLFATNLADTQILVPDPSNPYVAELEGGVTVTIPLILFADDSGTLPAHDIVQQELNSQLPPRASRFGTIAILWNIHQHFFPYWQEVEVDWLGALKDALTAATTSDPQNFLEILQRLTAKLEDGHTITARTTGEGIYGNYTVPFSLDIIEDELTVTTVDAKDISIEVGDAITEINDRPALEVLAEMEGRVGGVNQYRDFKSIQQLLSDTQATSLKVTLEPASGVSKKELIIPRSKTGFDHLREPRPPTVARLSKDVLYVDLTRISKGQFWTTLQYLKRAPGIVFDMRGYPNQVAFSLLKHLSDEPLSTPPFLLPIVTQPDHKDVNYIDVSTVWAEPKSPRLTDNIAFVTNANNGVSFAESILGIVEGYDLGERVGQPTAGANGDTIQADLPGGIWTVWSGLSVTKFDGSSLFGVGVAPTVPVERTREGVAQDRDELLEKAFEVVSGQAYTAMNIEKVWAVNIRWLGIMAAAIITAFSFLVFRKRRNPSL